MTQGIRLRQRALSSTSPAMTDRFIMKKTQNCGKTEVGAFMKRPEEDLVETAKLNPALAECLAAIKEIKA